MFRRTVLTLSLLLAVFICACQETPKENVVMGKQQDFIESSEPISTLDSETKDIQNAQELDKALGDEKPKIIYPEIVKEELDTGDPNLEIVIDAVVDTPSTDKIPIFDIYPRNYTKEEIERVISVCFPDSKMYRREFLPPLTKPQIEQMIIDVKASIEDLNNNISITPEKKESLREEYNTSLKNLEEKYPTAPDKTELGEYSVDKITEDKNAMLIFLDKLTGNSRGSAHINSGDFDDMGMRINQIMITNRDSIKAFNVEKKDVTSDIAKKIAYKLGFEELELFGEYGDNDMTNDDSSKTYVFMRQYDGISCNYSVSSKTASSSSNESYSCYWTPESLEIEFFGKNYMRIMHFSPSTKGEYLKSSKDFLPFDEVMSIFTKNIALKNTLTEDTSKLKMVVYRIKLGLMQVSKVNEQDKYMMIPVWDFYGNYSIAQKQSPENAELASEEDLKNINLPIDSVLTINALDGSLIDRTLGY